MPSLSDLGLAPEEPRRHEARRNRYVIHDESGARPLPTEAYDSYLDEEVELPGVARSQAWLYFGIGVGLGLAALAIVAGLYFRGVIAGPELAPSPPSGSPSTAAQEARLAEWMDVHAIELARLADVRLSAAALPATQVESTDVEVVEEPLSAPHPRPPVGAAADEGPGTNQLSNELDELGRSLRPRGPTAPPRAPSNEQGPPEQPLPAPAEPTAPAETSPPLEPSAPTNPY